MPWLRRLTLRARLMLVGVVGLTVGLAVGGVTLVVALNGALLRTTDAEALATAEGIARLVDQRALSYPLPVDGKGAQVQVVDAQGRVVASSVGADRLVPLLYPAELAETVDRRARFIPGDRIGIEGQVRVVTLTAGPAGDRQRVLVARSTAVLTQSVRLLRTVLLIAFPLLVGLLAVVAWRVVGAILRPVEALRRGAEEITGGTRAGQLPVPASSDEIHRLAVTLNDMLARLDAARLRQRAFVADAAHELRSPLTNIRTELEVAQRLADRTDWPALAGDVLTDVDRLTRLVDDLLLLARADDADVRGAGRPRSSGAPVELGRLLADTAGRYPSPPVRLDRPAGPVWTTGSADDLRRVVANLLDNAVRHADTTVRLAVTAGAAYHLVTVSDDGPGIPAADRERVFGRFTRLDGARARDAGGSGLGLAIVRELVRRHGGTVLLTDAGPGVRAEVRLPAAHPLAPGGAEPQPASPAIPTS